MLTLNDIKWPNKTDGRFSTETYKKKITQKIVFYILFSVDILCKYTIFVCVELTRRLFVYGRRWNVSVVSNRNCANITYDRTNRVSLGIVFGPPKPFSSGPKSRGLPENGRVIISYSTWVPRHRDTWQSRLLRHPNDRCQSLKREELLDSSEQVSVRVRCCWPRGALALYNNSRIIMRRLTRYF